MTGQRVLIVAYNFPPNAMVGTMRTLRLVERLVSEGWDTRVLTVSPKSYGEHEPLDADLTARVPLAVRVMAPGAWRPVARLQRSIRRLAPGSVAAAPRAATAPGAVALPQRSVLRRTIDLVDLVTTLPDQESGWIAPAIMRGTALAFGWRPHVLYTTSPPWSAQVVGYGLSRVLRCPWVADFRDPWARGPWREHRPALMMRVWQALEHRVVHHAAAIVLNTRRIRREFLTYYGHDVAAKFHVIPNGCDADEIAPIDRVAPDRFVLLHAGSLYGGRSPLTLMRAIARAGERGELPSGFNLVLLGATPDAAALSLIEELDLSAFVHYMPRVTRREGLSHMAAASALLLLQQGHELSVPAKTYEYLAAGRPILALTEDGATADVVRESGVGVLAAAADIEAVRLALVEVIALTRTGVAPVPREMYDGKARAADLTALFARITRSQDGRHAARAVAEREGDHRA